MVRMIDDYKEAMMAEIEEALEIARLDEMQARQLATHYAQCDWDCVPDEYKTPHDPAIEMAYKDSRFEYHLTLLLEEMDVDCDLIYLMHMLNDTGDAKYELFGKSYVANNVFFKDDDSLLMQTENDMSELRVVTFYNIRSPASDEHIVFTCLYRDVKPIMLELFWSDLDTEAIQAFFTKHQHEVKTVPIGGTTYIVRSFFKDDAKGNVIEKVKRLIERDAGN